MIYGKKRESEYACRAMLKEHNKKLAGEKAMVLKDLNMEYFAMFTSEVEDDAWGDKKNKWISDAYTITLINTETKKQMKLNFRQGTGHRLEFYESNGRPGFIRKIPNPLLVLSCIRSDNPNGESFEDWASNFGFDTDSRTALKTYLACQEQTDKFRQTFPDVDLETYKPLEDY